jgi:hypothetical protein
LIATGVAGLVPAAPEFFSIVSSLAKKRVMKLKALILRRPRSSRGRLEGWQQARPSKWPSFETRR